MSVPALPYEHSLMVKAIKDYKGCIQSLFENTLWSRTCPLSDEDNINGIPGQKFMDAIKVSTAIGYPLTGPKSHHMLDLEPTARHPCRRTFMKHIWDRISHVEECYRRGERAYEVAKAQKKDEILKADSGKCRIFYGNSVALTFLIRKYYLPIIRVIQMNPLKSECAVGINCHGPEWEEFHNHVLKNGTERLFGGDYGKYDQKLPSQLILSSLRILIDMAKLCEYSSADVTVMEALAGDIVYSMVAYNGDLLGLTEGGHISGNSLTVDINSIAGSLSCRCLYYTLYPQTTVPFQDVVALMTYGDDNIGTVREGYEEFNIKNFSNFLKDYGQIYTMPSKDDDIKEYITFDEFEFLKRMSIYHEKLGMHVGALSESSIFKSLHCYMRGKRPVLTEQQACATNISGAMREWFNHGEEKYELRRQQMIKVAERANIFHMVEADLELSYDDRVLEWRERYITKTRPPERVAVFDLD
jgi:hypothetical protein